MRGAKCGELFLPRTQFPTTSTLLAKGWTMDETDRCARYAWYARQAYANYAMPTAIHLCRRGAVRRSVTGKVTLGPGAEDLHIDIDPAEIGKVYIGTSRWWGLQSHTAGAERGRKEGRNPTVGTRGRAMEAKSSLCGTRRATAGSTAGCVRRTVQGYGLAGGGCHGGWAAPDVGGAVLQVHDAAPVHHRGDGHDGFGLRRRSERPLACRTSRLVIDGVAVHHDERELMRRAAQDSG